MLIDIPIFIKGLVSSAHILQGMFSSWNKEKLCSPGATKIFVLRARSPFVSKITVAGLSLE